MNRGVTMIDKRLDEWEDQTNEQIDLNDQRNAVVRKANALIQKTSFALSAQQQKIIAYLISKIEPFTNQFDYITFDVQTYCKIAGLDYKNSGNLYKEIMNSIQQLADKSLWIELDENSKEKTLVRWISNPVINEQTGQVKIKFDDVLKPYLLQLRSNYTEMVLINEFALSSRYAVRLYEIVKSVHYNSQEPYRKTFEIDDLRNKLSATAESLKDYKQFRKFVLDTSIAQINERTDLLLSYTTKKLGRKIHYITFRIELKENLERLKAYSVADESLNEYIYKYENNKEN